MARSLQNHAKATSLGQAGAPARNSKTPNWLYQMPIKTQIDKCRRARIIVSLEQLKKLLQQPLDRQDKKPKSHLGKAEIPEIKVQHLRQLKQQGTAAASPSQDGQEFADGYCHCLKTVRFFLTTASSSLSQGRMLQILKHLEETSGMRPCAPLDPAPKDWSAYKPIFAFLWLFPSLEPAGIPSSDSHTFTLQSWLHPSVVPMLSQHHLSQIPPIYADHGEWRSASLTGQPQQRTGAGASNCSSQGLSKTFWLPLKNSPSFLTVYPTRVCIQTCPTL